MTTELQMFEGQSVMILTKDDVDFDFAGDFIISAKDVAAVLEYKGDKATTHVLKFCKEKHVYLVKNSDLPNRKVRNIKLNNAGEKFISNYSLNRVMGQSGQPKAEQFQDWVYEDVLPSIQKHGMWANQELLDNPDLLIAVATELKKERAERQRLEMKVEADQPKVAFADAIATSEDTILVREMSKIIQKEGIKIGEKKLFGLLREWGYILRHRNEPTQIAMNQDLFQVEERVVKKMYGNKIATTLRVTPKGQIRIVNKLKEIPLN